VGQREQLLHPRIHARPFVGVFQRSIYKRTCQLLAINAGKWLQERSNQGAGSPVGVSPEVVRMVLGPVYDKSQPAYRGTSLMKPPHPRTLP
jgi:hypothetical protein